LYPALRLLVLAMALAGNTVEDFAKAWTKSSHQWRTLFANFVSETLMGKRRIGKRGSTTSTS
jgi:hypothetical protein